MQFDWHRLSALEPFSHSGRHCFLLPKGQVTAGKSGGNVVNRGSSQWQEQRFHSINPVIDAVPLEWTLGPESGRDGHNTASVLWPPKPGCNDKSQVHSQGAGGWCKAFSPIALLRSVMWCDWCHHLKLNCRELEQKTSNPQEHFLY